MFNISKSNFRKRRLKRHIQYTRFSSPAKKFPSRFTRVKYKKLVYKYKKFRNSRRRRRLLKRLRYFYYRRIYKFLAFCYPFRSKKASKFFSSPAIWPFASYKFYIHKNRETYRSWRISTKSIFYHLRKPRNFHFSKLDSKQKKKPFKRYQTFLARKRKKKKRYLRRFKRRLKYYLRRSFKKRNRVFFRKRKLRKKKIRINKYHVIKKYSSTIIAKRFVRSLRYGFTKTLKYVKGIRNILGVRVIKTYNNFFVALQTSLGQNILSYSTGRVDLRRNRRLTKQALEIASRDFSMMLRRRKFSLLNFTIVGRATYHSRIFIRALKRQGVRIRAIRFVLRRAHNGLRARSSRRV